MKETVKLLMISAFLLISFGLKAQVSDEIYYNRLFYVCKAWGHVKYYHTNTASGDIDWDQELLKAANGFKTAPDNDAFNDSLLLMLESAGQMGLPSGIITETPDSLMLNDLSWIQDPILSEEVKANLDTITSRFRHQSNVYVTQDWAGGPPVFTSDDAYFYGNDYPVEPIRLLALCRYWNIINYFFPYKDIMDQDWETTLMEFIPQVVGAEDAYSFHSAFKKFSTRINDSHGSFYSEVSSEMFGAFYPPFNTRYIENEMVITKVLPNVTEVSVGDVIKEIDGQDVYEYRDSLRLYAHGSNDEIIERETNKLIMKGALGDFQLTVDNGTSTHTETLNRNGNNGYAINEDDSPLWRDTVINENCSFGIVNMGKLTQAQVPELFEKFWEKDAIIFDIRNYPNGTIWYIVNYLYPSSINIANFTIPDITYPGRLYWDDEIIGTGTTEPYPGKVIMLFDERTQSQAEYTCMGLEQFPGAIKIGSTTAGADGNVALINLTSGMRTYATFLGTYYPDYSPTQRIGIVPDYEVRPTIEGIRAGKDEVLDFALNCDFTEIKTKDVKTYYFYPNPAKNVIHYNFANQQTGLIELYDIQGRKLKSYKVSDAFGSLDISEIKRGLYVVKFQYHNQYKSELIIIE